MSSNKSNLSSSKYGYDFVVATTQESINATMKEFLSTLAEPTVNICYVADENGNPTAIDYDKLKAAANGSDPFSIPNGADPNTNKDLQNLYKARFMVGFKAKIGIPPGIAPTNVPDIVTLGQNTASVIYNLMCEEFQVVQYKPQSGYSPAQWMNESQPAGKPWLFTSKVDLRLTTSDQSAYSKLPPDVRARIKNLGDMAFSVQQLLFDLDNAALESIPVMSGVDPGTNLYNVLQTDFLGKYFQAVKANGDPVLGCAIKRNVSDPGTLHLTDLNMEVSPYVGDNGQPIQNPSTDLQELCTLNYLCASGGHELPAAVPFTWNWIDQYESDDYQGVASINRNTFARYIKEQLYNQVSENCIHTHVRVWLSGILDGTCNWHGDLQRYQPPTITYPPTGDEVLNFAYSSSSFDQAGLNGDIGRMRLNSSMNVSVKFTGNQIIVEQHLVLYLMIRSLASSVNGNIVDKKITDTFTLSIDEHGKLNSTLTSTSADNSKNLSTNWFIGLFTDLNHLLSNFEGWGKKFVSADFEDIPLNFAQDFIFPGGKVFTFKNVGFSDNQDIVSHIDYCQPS